MTAENAEKKIGCLKIIITAVTAYIKSCSLYFWKQILLTQLLLYITKYDYTDCSLEVSVVCIYFAAATADKSICLLQLFLTAVTADAVVLPKTPEDDQQKR